MDSFNEYASHGALGGKNAHFQTFPINGQNPKKANRLNAVDTQSIGWGQGARSNFGAANNGGWVQDIQNNGWNNYNNGWSDNQAADIVWGNQENGQYNTASTEWSQPVVEDWSNTRQHQGLGVPKVTITSPSVSGVRKTGKIYKDHM